MRFDARICSFAFVATLTGAALAACSTANEHEQVALIGTTCTPSDYDPSFRRAADCYQVKVEYGFLPEGVVTLGSTTYAAADPFFASFGWYERYDVNTPQQVADARNAESPGTYEQLAHLNAEYLAAPVPDTGKTLGDYFRESSETNEFTLRDHVLVNALHDAPFLTTAPLSDQWEFTTDGKTLTVVFTNTLTDMYLPGSAKLVWSVPGRIIDTNGEVHGKAITWDYGSGTRFYASFEGVNKGVLEAIAAAD
jgi:hypothetical protein